MHSIGLVEIIISLTFFNYRLSLMVRGGAEAQQSICYQ